MSGFEWPTLMRAGLQQLGLRPAEFWALTPGELKMMLGHDAADAPLDRTGLATLLRAFPDSKKE